MVTDTTQTDNSAGNPTSGGILDHIKVAEPSPADKPMTDQTTPSTDTTQQSATPTDEAGTEEKTTQPVTFDTAKVTIKGREFTGKDLVKAYESSSDEGLRLSKVNKQLQETVAQLEKQYLELQTKFEETPPFKILTEDEIAELPVPKQVEYLTQKQKWESDKTSRKEELAKLQTKEQQMQEQTKSYVIARSQHMSETPDKWPEYSGLVPIMEQIIEVAPFLTGYRETPDILYYTALGLKAYREQVEKKVLESKSKQEASAQAKAQATATSGTGVSAPIITPGSENEDSDEAFNKRILQKAQKPLFSV